MSLPRSKSHVVRWNLHVRLCKRGDGEADRLAARPPRPAPPIPTKLKRITKSAAPAKSSAPPRARERAESAGLEPLADPRRERSFSRGSSDLYRSVGRTHAAIADHFGGTFLALAFFGHSIIMLWAMGPE
jgi:hypothetical protein